MPKCRTRQFILTTDTGYDFFTHTVNVSPRTGSNDCHDHDYIEIVMVIDGIMTTEINGEYSQLPPNTLIFLRPQDKHYVAYDTQERHRDMCFTSNLFKSICDFLTEGLFESYLNAPEPTILQIPDYTVAEIESASQKIAFNMDIKMSDVIMQIKSLGIRLLDFYLNNHKRVFKPVNATTTALPEVLNELLYTLELNSNIENKSLDEILDEMHYNKVYLRRLFKQYMKTDLSKYWLDKKLTRAATLLRISNMSAKDISLQCGFQSYAYFNKMFIQRYGTTPRRYKLGQ